VNAKEVVIDVVQGNRVDMVFDLLAVSIGHSGEAAHLDFIMYQYRIIP